jgi:hypothetical protein
MALTWAQARLLVDIWSMKLFVWMLGRNGELLDSHLFFYDFFYDRYSDLVDYHRSRGRIGKAERLTAIAEAYYQAAPDDDEPPEAAAIAMPAPRPPVYTNAVSATRMMRPPGRRSDLSGVQIHGWNPPVPGRKSPCGFGVGIGCTADPVTETAFAPDAAGASCSASNVTSDAW